jgi:hypothetical protein
MFVELPLGISHDFRLSKSSDYLAMALGEETNSIL